MPLFLVPLLRPAAPLLVVQLAQLETAGGHQVVVTTLPRAAEVQAGTEVLACHRFVRLLAAAVAVVAPVAVTVVMTTAAEIAVRIRLSPCARDNRPGHENLTGSDLKSLTRSNARSSRP